MTAYYNEIEPYAAQWLRNLIAAGHIAPGDVDTRSIEDVHPDDLRGYRQCHFFAGIGVWSYSLRLAGWPDDRPVWTGSCPCQPFSTAGKGAGFDDERHLWPSWQWLIQKHRPPVVFGEQVASAAVGPWIDLVHADMEGLDYALGCVPFPSAGVGAPHIRDRNFWMAYANSGTCREGSPVVRGRPLGSDAQSRTGFGSGGMFDRLADTAGQRRGKAGHSGARHSQWPTDAAPAGRPHLVNGFWSDADWLLCRDGKWRPVESGYEQMVDGSAGSLGRVCASAIQEIEGEIDAWSIRYHADPAEGMRRMWCDLRTKALCEREAGRFSGVQSPAVLLAFLRQLTEQGWRFADALAREGAAAPQIVMRVLRFDPSAARTPLRRELAEQLADELADPVQELPSILAHHAAKCWGDACREKAGAASFPLAHNAPARVGRLRAYGNAINAQAAKAFIQAAIETIGQ